MQDSDLLENKLLLRPDEAARVLRISKKSVYRRCKTGMLETAPYPPLRITVKSVKKYMNIEEKNA